MKMRKLRLRPHRMGQLSIGRAIARFIDSMGSGKAWLAFPEQGKGRVYGRRTAIELWRKK